MAKKIVFLFFFLTSVFIFKPQYIFSQSIDEINSQIDQNEKKLIELGKAKNTLANQIKLLDSQYQLTLLKITQTENSIKTLEKEIANLDVEISKLEVQINQLSVAYIHQTVQNYKLQKRIPAFAFLFSSNLNTFLEQQRYMTSVQKNSQTNLLDMETVRTNYDIQKTAKEKKQVELEELKKTLASQKISLNGQKIAKSQLLKTTEEEYEKVIQQLAALRSFSTSVGGNICLDSVPGVGSDGNFYSQRDPRWCKKYIGISKDTVGEVGCYISSLSMVYKKIGSGTTPLTYASDPSNFWGNTAYMVTPNPPSGYIYKQTSYSTNTIDNELRNGRYVIAQMKMANVAGMHFIVIISGSNGNYKIHDPWFGADQNFSDRYSPNLVMSLRLITK